MEQAVNHPLIETRTTRTRNASTHLSFSEAGVCVLTDILVYLGVRSGRIRRVNRREYLSHTIIARNGYHNAT
jgi:hypothetical protein